MARQKLTKKQREKKELKRKKLEEKAAEQGLLDIKVICDTCKREQPYHKGPCWNCGAEIGVYA